MIKLINHEKKTSPKSTLCFLENSFVINLWLSTENNIVFVIK